MEVISQPLFNLLIVFYKLSFNNLGIAIILFTGFIRLLLFPITLPSLKMMQKMRDLGPDLAKLKKKHATDKKKLTQAQADLYRERGVNPASGCLPQILNIVILFVLFNVFTSLFKSDGNSIDRMNNVLYPPLHLTESIDTRFLGVDLARPDVLKIEGLLFPLPGIFLLSVTALQFLSSVMSYPAAKKEEKLAKKTKESFDDAAASMQKQMLYFFPLITLTAGYSFPLGLLVYWGSLSVYQMIQQYYISGWGGLEPWVKKVVSR